MSNQPTVQKSRGDWWKSICKTWDGNKIIWVICDVIFCSRKISKIQFVPNFLAWDNKHQPHCVNSIGASHKSLRIKKIKKLKFEDLPQWSQPQRNLARPHTGGWVEWVSSSYHHNRQDNHHHHHNYQDNHHHHNYYQLAYLLVFFSASIKHGLFHPLVFAQPIKEFKQFFDTLRKN